MGYTVKAEHAALAGTILDQCAKQRDRFAIFDLFDGTNPNVDLNVRESVSE